MDKINKKDQLKYYKFLNSLPKKINKLYFGKLRGKFKLNNKSNKKNGFDPVTNIDRAFELFLRKEITKRFPKDGVVGEEFKAKKTKDGFTWVIDPIDGTRSFIIGSPTWSNLISINYKNILKVSKSKSLNSSKIAGGFFGWLSLDEQKKISKLTRLMRYPCSDALSYCQLSEGKLDVVLQCYNKIWDIHPMIPLIKNAGGYITTWKNKDPRVGGSIVASSSMKIHKKVLNLLKPVA